MKQQLENSPLLRAARLAGRSLRAALAEVLWTDGEGALHSAVWGAEDAEERRACSRGALHTLAMRVYHSGEPLLFADSRLEHDCPPPAGDAFAFAGVPLAAGGDARGAVCVAKPGPHAWTPEEQAVLEDFAAWLAADVPQPRRCSPSSDAEDARRETEERYRLMVEGSEQVFFYEHDTAHRFTYLSPSVHAVMGYRVADLIGRPFEDVLTGDASDVDVQELTDAALLSGERSAPYLALVRRRDGRERTIEIVESPVIRDGRVVGMQGFARDVTERAAREEELQRKTAYLDRLFDSAPEAVVLLDNDDRVIRVNQEFARMFGYTPEEVEGRRIDDLIVPEDQHGRAVEITATVSGGDGIDLEAVRRRKDGTLLDVWILGAPIRVRGSQIAVYGIYRDITERKKAEARLGAAEAHYRRLVETSPYGIYSLDRQGRCVEVNPVLAAILGRTVQQCIGLEMASVVAPHQTEYAVDAFRQMLTGERMGAILELHVVRPSGEHRRVEVRSVAVREAGRITGTHGAVRDTTEEHAMALQLRRAERFASLGTLLSGVAHELNNPLTSIKNFAQLLLLDKRSEQDAEALEIVHREAGRAAKIVADLRRVSPQPRATEAEREPVDLNDVVRHVLRVRRYALAAQGVEITEDLAPDMPPVWADRAQLEQTVFNLVLNSEHAMPAAPGERRILLSTRPGLVGATLVVQDTGTGIRPEHLERIFDPFFTTKAPGEGTGLGLSLVHRMVAEHGGRVQAFSEAGRGARFVVELPLAAPFGDAG